MSKIRVRRGARVHIKINKDAGESNTAPLAPLPPISDASSRPSAANHRPILTVETDNRYRPKRNKTEGIDFYDLARVKDPDEDDIFFDLNIEFPAQVATVDETIPGFPPRPATKVFPVTPAQRAIFHQKLLQTPRGVELKDDREKLGYDTSDNLYLDIVAYNYAETNKKQIAVAKRDSREYVYFSPATTVNTDDWTEDKGLKLPKNKQNLEIKSYGFFEPFDTGSLDFKVTDVFDYTADTVFFELKKGHVDCFLVPRLFLEMPAAGDFDQAEGSNSEGTFRRAYANAVFTILPRFLVDYLAPYTYQGLFSGNSIPFQINNAAGLTFKQKITELIYGRDAQRMFGITTTYPLGSNVPDLLVSQPLSAWAGYIAARGNIYDRYARIYNLYQRQDGPTSGGGIYAQNPGFSASTGALTAPQAGSLCGILKQRDKTYYVWATRESPNWKGIAIRQQANNPVPPALPETRSQPNEIYNQWYLR